GAAARGGEGRTTVVALQARPGTPTHAIRELPETVEKLRKAEVLRRADDAARSAGGAIRQVSAAYADARKRVLIANSDGLLVSDDRVRTRFMVSCTALGDGGLQSGYEGPGRTVGFELFDDFNPEDVARTAAGRALRMLEARPAPVGKLPVVLRQGAGGVLFHEACGHGLEADLVSRDASVFQGRLGAQVASPLVTLVDDGTFDRGRGTLPVDNGRLTAPVRAANLIGNGPETLLGIDAVGTDFDTWAGTCGKDGQGVPVSAGQPTVRVAEMTVGGTAGV